MAEKPQKSKKPSWVIDKERARRAADHDIVGSTALEPQGIDADVKGDLANIFLSRCLDLSMANCGAVQIVMPQNWLFLSGYKKQRESLLKRVQWNLLARLGEGGFESPQAAGAFIILLTQTRTPAGSAPSPTARGSIQTCNSAVPRPFCPGMPPPNPTTARLNARNGTART